jgi:hypothetical protein
MPPGQTTSTPTDATSAPPATQQLLNQSASLQSSQQNNKATNALPIPARQPSMKSASSTVITSASARAGGRGAPTDNGKSDAGDGTKSRGDGNDARPGPKPAIDGGTALLLMCLSDVLWVSTQCGSLMDECAAIVTR